MRILVTGATGYLGFRIATALRRAGHHVIGLTRSPARSRRLWSNEIEPVIGAIERPESYRAIAAGCAVAVHAAVDCEADVFAIDRLAVETLLAAGPDLLVYTSGLWIYGATGRTAVDERSPIAPVARVRRRPEMEQLALSGAGGVRGVVFRPGCAYGGEGGMFGAWFEPLARGEAPTIVGDGVNHWPLIHVDDLADAYVKAVESRFAREIFNLNDGSRETVTEMVTAACAAAGFRGAIRYQPMAEAAETLGTFAECIVLDQHLDSSKATRLLGWQPRMKGFADQASVYYEAWKAARTSS